MAKRLFDRMSTTLRILATIIITGVGLVCSSVLADGYLRFRSREGRDAQGYLGLFISSALLLLGFLVLMGLIAAANVP